MVSQHQHSRVANGWQGWHCTLMEEHCRNFLMGIRKNCIWGFYDPNSRSFVLSCCIILSRFLLRKSGWWYTLITYRIFISIFWWCLQCCRLAHDRNSMLSQSYRHGFIFPLIADLFHRGVDCCWGLIRDVRRRVHLLHRASYRWRQLLGDIVHCWFTEALSGDCPVWRDL